MATPPMNYVCRICDIPGHWIQQCPNKWKKSQSQHVQQPSKPPTYYICHKCHQRGHWIKDCPNKFNRYKHTLNTNNNQNNYNKISLPPSNYICNKCHKPGHWIQQCPNIIKSTPPTNYVCYRCCQPGHWIQYCPKNDFNSSGQYHQIYPVRNILKLVQLNDDEIMQIATDYNMTEEDITKWVNICKTQQWNRFKKIDNALDKYYKSFKVYDYKNENGIGKFLQFCELNNFKPHELGAKLIGPSITYKNCIYVGWDNNFPFDPTVNINADDRKHVMHEVIKFCHIKGYSPTEVSNKTNMNKIRKIVGLAKHKTYHILSDEYCVDDDGNDLDCKYCGNSNLYHIYLVTGYIGDFVPNCIVALIVSYFESLSSRLNDIRNRNNYLLNYWRNWTASMVIYKDGRVYLSSRKTMIFEPNQFCPEKKFSQINQDEMERLQYLLVQHTGC